MKKTLMLAGLMAAVLAGTAAWAQPNAPVMRDAHALVFANTTLQRQVEEVPGGVKTTTTTTDESLLPVLRRHPRDMYQRYADGGMVRRWDPMFLELAKVHDKITYDVRNVDNGVEVLATSDDANVTRLIRAHAAKVSDMQKRGADAMREATPLPAEYKVSDAAAPATCNPTGRGPRANARGNGQCAVQNGQACRYDGVGQQAGRQMRKGQQRQGQIACNGGQCQRQGMGQGQGKGQMQRGQGQGKGMCQAQCGQGRGQGNGQMQRGQGQGKGFGQMQRGQGRGQNKGFGQMQRGQGQGYGQMRRGQGQGQGQGYGQMRRGQGQGRGNMQGARRGGACALGTCPNLAANAG